MVQGGVGGVQRNQQHGVENCDGSVLHCRLRLLLLLLLFVAAGLELFVLFCVALVGLHLSSQLGQQLLHVLQQRLVLAAQLHVQLAGEGERREASEEEEEEEVNETACGGERPCKEAPRSDPARLNS